jgi:diguanylate cyclase (GGDEF)-like protein/PAS domain S-box-containing protein
MFVLRSARGRAILAAAVPLLLVVSIGALAVSRARDDEQLHETLDRTSAASTALEGAQAGFWQAQAALSALVISGDVTWVDDYDTAMATADQELAKARSELLAMGEAGKVAALDDLTGHIDEFNQTVRWLFPTIIEADRQSVLDLANSSMSEMTATNRATIADLEKIVQETQQEAAAEREAGDRAADTTLWLLLGLGCVALATGVGTVITLLGWVVGPLASLRASVSAIASGDSEARARVFGPEEVASLARDFNDMTEALATKALALQESEKRYRLIADNATDLIWTMDMGLHYTYISPSVQRLRGYSVEEAMAHTVDQDLCPSSLDVAMKTLTKELARQRGEEKDLARARTLELEHFCKNGSTIWLEVTTTFLRGDDGQPVGLLGVSRDISERKQAQKEQEESEKRYRLLADNASDIIWTMDMNLRLTYESPSVARIRGYSPEEAMTQTMEETLTPASLEVARKAFAEELTLEGAEQRDLSRSRTLELEHTCKDGSTVWLEVTTTFLRDEDGRAVGILGASRDISERKRAEEELQHLATLPGENPNPVIRAARNGTVLYANQGSRPLLELWGCAEGGSLPPEPWQPVESVLTAGKMVTSEASCGDKTFLVIWAPVAGRDYVNIYGVDISERKRMEEQLRESEARYKALLAGAPVGMIVVDLQTKQFRYANPGACRMFGYTEEEFLRIGVADLSPKEFLDHVLAEFEAQLRGEKLLSLDIPCLRKDGTLFYADIRGIAIVLDGRKCNVGIFTDVTERKRAEDALRESEEKYRELVENINEIIYSVDSNGLITYISPVVEQFGGYTPCEVIGRPFTEFVHPDDILPLMHSFRETVAGNLEPFEYRVLTKSGETHWVRTSSRPVMEGDRFVGFRAVLTDITERKRAEEKLEESKRLLENVTQGITEGILLLSKDFEILWANNAILEETGCEMDQVLGKRCHEIAHRREHPCDDRLNPCPIREAQKIRQPVTATHAHFDAAGEEHITEVAAYPVRDEKGEIVQWVHVSRDVTERKRTEGAVLRAKEEWERTFDAVPDMIAIIDEHYHIVRANRAMAERLGLTPDECVGKVCYEVVHGLDCPPEFCPHTLSQADGRDHAAEVKEPRLGGEFLVSVTPLADQQGRRIGSVHVARDITDRKRAEEELRESESKYRTLVENIPQKVFFKDRNCIYVSCNGDYARDLSLNHDEIAGKTDYDFYPRELADKYRADDKRVMQSGETEDIEEEYVHDGRQSFIHTIKTPVKDEEGSVVGVLGVFWDVTERKQAEEERTRLQAELEVRVITDGLTGLYNHAHFYQRLAEETERSGRYNGGFAVAMMDVDNFKRFNDSRGHQEGDKMLRLVADSIRSGLRGSDLAFRYGGDEFAAILLHADAARARAVMERIKKRLAKGLAQMNDGAASCLSLSAGIACFRDDGSTPDALVRIADTALYAAKWAAQTRQVCGESYAVQSLKPPPAMAASGMLSTTAGSLAAALRELGVPDVMAELNLRTVAALGTLAEIKDPYVRGHQERTSDWAATLAQEMGLSQDRVRGTRLAGLVHDLGKAGVSKRILRKPGKLTEEEFAEIKEHPPLGSMMIISEVEALQQLVPIVRHHHERFDGKGYPDGLTGEDIPLEARILGVVDAFDAMTHERSYRKAMSRGEALAELERGAGTQFDPAVVEVFLAWAAKECEDLPARRQDNNELAAAPTTKV